MHHGSSPKRLPRNAAAKQKTRWDWCASGLKSVLMSDLLSTPQSARRMAVMMMVAMGVVNENHEGKE
jgi:hypothetical protein